MQIEFNSKTKKIEIRFGKFLVNSGLKPHLSASLYLMVTTDPSSRVISREKPPSASSRLSETGMCNSPSTIENSSCGSTFTAITTSPLFTSRRRGGDPGLAKGGPPKKTTTWKRGASVKAGQLQQTDVDAHPGGADSSEAETRMEACFNLFVCSLGIEYFGKNRTP